MWKEQKEVHEQNPMQKKFTASAYRKLRKPQRCFD